MTDRLARLYPHWLLASLCAGVAAANATRSAWPGVAALAVALALLAAAAVEPARLPLLALALTLGGWWWGSARLASIDRSALEAEIGRAGRSRLVVIGPARRSRFELRVPARVKRFETLAVDEPVLLELPLGRAPPQGAVLEVVAVVGSPRGPDHGFDERTWLRRHGVHVVLHGDRWRMLGRRGGLGGVADRLRARLARTLAPGLEGERRAVLAGVVLGEDEGLSDELRDRFRASGLYHLLRLA